MESRQWGFAGLLALAGLAFWLLLAGPSNVLGIDTGQAGTALLVASAWISLYAVSRLPRRELGRVASLGEWKAWIGTGFMALVIGYFLAKIDVLAGASTWNNPEANAVGGNLAMLLIAWAVLSSVMSSRWKGEIGADEVEEDERDRGIAVRASGWGRGALTLSIIGFAVMLGFSPAHKLQWATHLMIANLLIFALMWGCLMEYAVTAILYWRDRR